MHAELWGRSLSHSLQGHTERTNKRAHAHFSHFKDLWQREWLPLWSPAQRPPARSHLCFPAKTTTHLARLWGAILCVCTEFVLLVEEPTKQAVRQACSKSARQAGTQRTCSPAPGQVGMMGQHQRFPALLHLCEQPWQHSVQRDTNHHIILQLCFPTKLLLLLQQSGEAPLALIEHILASICWEETLMRGCGEENTHAHSPSLSLSPPLSLSFSLPVWKK